MLPCDLICELDGTALADAWMVEQGGFAGASGGLDAYGNKLASGAGGEKLGRRGGLGVWYQTKCEDSKKGAETDFIATTPLPTPIVPAPVDSLRRHIANLVYSVPTDTLNDITEENKTFPIRHSLLRKHARIKMLTTHRDAHIYFFPYWVIEMIKKNEKFESISEEVLGWWAKAGWQQGLGEKLGLRQILQGDEQDEDMGSQLIEEEIDVSRFSTTYSSAPNSSTDASTPPALASRVTRSSTIPDAAKSLSVPKLTIPPILAYVQPCSAAAPLIRRVDDSHLLLAVSLRLAKLPSIEEVGRDAASPFAHAAKVAHRDSIPRRCRVEAENSLLADNVIVEEKTNIKESVIGYNCKIGEGARLLRCLLMDGVEVGSNVQLTDCILGRRCRIEGGEAKGDERTVLKECEVQDGQVVEWGSKSCRLVLVCGFPCPLLTWLQRSRRMKSLCGLMSGRMGTRTAMGMKVRLGVVMWNRVAVGSIIVKLWRCSDAKQTKWCIKNKSTAKKRYKATHAVGELFRFAQRSIQLACCMYLFGKSIFVLFFFWVKTCFLLLFIVVLLYLPFFCYPNYHHPCPSPP